MTTLALVRHAKSDWDDPSVPDHDRPLNARGRRDAPRMAALLAARPWRPSVILTSTALRATTTAAAFAAALDVPLREVAGLYGADAQTLLDTVRAAGSDIMIVAHDPGLSVLGSHLSDAVPLMPTCAVATFAWEEDEWERALQHAPLHVTYDIPRDHD